MMIEQNTNYAYKLKYIDNPTFDKVRDLSTKFYRELPQALQNELFEAMNRGVDILDSEPQMTTYLYAFGKMHQAKLEYAFSKLPEEFLEQPEINIIDYGCGQALGTMCYADFLRKKGYAQKVKTITLIEPSEICLKRAALHVSVFFPKAEIKTVNKKFDNLTKDDIVCSEETPTLHILSNVLDMLNFDLEKFSALIKNSLKGYNQFVCVGPYFNYSDKDGRMDNLFSLLDGKDGFRETFDKYEFDLEKAWTAKTLCFSIGDFEEVELSTEVTYEDRVNEVADGCVRYSKDWNKLLYYLSSQPGTFTIKEGTRIICDEAFGHSGDCKLKQVIIPESVTHIGKKAFEDCKCLEQINIPDSILSIGNLAFKGCEKLKQITIPQSVKHIGDNPFITPALITSNSERFIIKNDMLIDLYEQRLICYLGGETDVVIPEAITTIGNYAFYGCNIEHVTIPDSVISIGDYAFADCPLQNFVISKSIIHIGNNPFDNCGVGEETPPWEPNEKRPSLNILSYSERFSALNDMLIDRTQHRLITYFGNDSIIRIPEDVTYIGDSAFSWCLSIEQIIIPDSVIGIGREAFGGCEKLCQINLPNGISTIEEGTFDCCLNLQQITIPNTVKSIGQWAFASCPITQINLPESIEFIGWRIFQGCHSLKQIIIPKGTYEKIVGLLDESQSYVAAIVEQ